MGEYVEKDMAIDTPGIGKWRFERKWEPYEIPIEWMPDRPYYPTRDKGKPRKERGAQSKTRSGVTDKGGGDDGDDM